MRLFKGHAITMAALLALPQASVAAAEPVKMRVAWIVPITNIASILFEKDGIARNNGKTYQLELIRFQGTTPMITALATNNIEIALLGFTSLPLAVSNGGMEDARIIIEEMKDGAPGYHSNEYMVLADGPIKSVADLKGQVLATNAFGSGVDIPMRAVLRKAGLDDKKDVTVIEAPFPAMKAMLMEKKVALIPSVPPFSKDPEMRKVGRTLFTQADGAGPSALGIWVAREDFIKKNRAALVDFAEDYLRAVRFFLDPANRADVQAIAGKAVKQPPERFDWVFTKGDYYRDPNGILDVKALQATIKLQVDLGLLKSSIDVAKYSDMSIVQEAAKRIN